MASDKTVARIACRFGTELFDIGEYVGFIRSKSALHVQEVDDLNALLQREEVKELLPVREHLGTNHYLTSAEVQELSPVIERISPRIDRAISSLNGTIDALPAFDQDGIADEHPGLLGEWISYLMPHMPVAASNDQITALRKQTIQRSDYELHGADEQVSREDRLLLIDEALKRAAYFKINARIETLQYLLDRFGEVKIVAKADRHDAVTGLLRQAFIILMAAFDAAIFDLVRVALTHKFFDLAQGFSKQEKKLSVSEIAGFGSFEKLRDDIIETQLSKQYVKGLLHLLCDPWKVECVDKASGGTFDRLIEIVLRRNVQLHNRGVIDDDYVKEAKFLDKLKPRDVAVIDDNYWQVARDYTSYCVQQVARWADS